MSRRDLLQYPEFQEFMRRSGPSTVASSSSLIDTADEVSKTPHESIAVAVASLRADLADQLLGRVRACTPSFFEQLIVDLLVGMKYGGGRATAGRALGRSGDGGVDGVIDEDLLGLDRIYLQAKRYKADNVVSVEAVRAFVGSLDEQRATKGVFVTTSRFSDSALKFAGSSTRRIVLIDGERLAELMIEHGVGVRERESILLQDLDAEYFEDGLGTLSGTS